MIIELILSAIRFVAACIIMALAACVLTVGAAWERVTGKGEDGEEDE